MRYDFNKMDADSFELMIRSLNQGIFGVKCEQYGLGPDGQREFVYEGTIMDKAGNVFEGRTIGQVKYKHVGTKQKDFTWLKKELEAELNLFREKEEQYRPNNYLFYTNVVLTPTKDTGIKDKINKFLSEKNDIIPNVTVLGYDEICALLDNNRDVAVTYASHILPGDILMQFLKTNKKDYSVLMQKYLARELEEDMYTRMDQAGSVTEKKISIEKVCVDIDVMDRGIRDNKKFAQKILDLGNRVLGYRKDVIKDDINHDEILKQDENFVLIGGPGRGKTTICQFIAQIYRANYLHETNYGDPYSNNFIMEVKERYQYNINCFRIPIKIILREYAAWVGRQGEDENISVIQYIRTRIQKSIGEELAISDIRQMLKELAWIFFFDGLDEVPESSNRVEILKQIKLFIETDLREIKCDCMIIGTTRMQGYNNDFDETRYKHLEVAELSKQDCEKYFIKLFEVMEEQTEKREEYIGIMREALEDDTTNRLMRTPLQTTIISILVKSGGKPPHERYSLFQQYYDTMVRREKQKGVMATLNDHTDWMQEIHFEVAAKLQSESEKKSNPSAEISQVSLKKLIRKYIEDNLDVYYEKMNDVEQKTDEFMKIITDRLCFLCENRDGYYSFSIRTMQEYFAGTYLVKGVGDENALINIKEIAYKSYWRNVLLFALGYIELEKMNLEKNIGNLCAEMNGWDNLVQAEYTADNVCLFGSWLALDILSENIFKGKNQNKYIEIAAKAFSLIETKNYNKFAFITGVQCDKLCSFVKENYQNKKENNDQVFALYMKLAENEKNCMEQWLDDLLEICDEQDKINYCIRILQTRLLFDKEWRTKKEKQLLQYITEEKVKIFLPVEVLSNLLQYSMSKKDVIVKKFLFEQCLYNRGISSKIMSEVFEIPWLEGVYTWLISNTHVDDSFHIKITPSFEYSILREVPDKQSVQEFMKFSEEIQSEYFVKLCDYALNPDYNRYIELRNVMESEPEYMAKMHRKCDIYGAPSTSKAEYEDYYRNKEIFYQLFQEDTLVECMKHPSSLNMNYSATCIDSVMDTLIKDGKYSMNNIAEMSDVFFKGYLFAAHVQLEYTRKDTILLETTQDNLLILLKEAERRRIYRFRSDMHVMLVVMFGSKYKDDLFEMVDDSFFEEHFVEESYHSGQYLLEQYPCISTEMINDVISHVVRRSIVSPQKNNYLQLLPLLMYRNIECRKCVSENDLKNLDEKIHGNDGKRFVVELLKLYCGQYNDEILEKMFQFNIPRLVVYNGLINLLDNCPMENGEELGVKLYLRLQDEQFKESNRLQNRIFERLMENRSTS